MKFHARIANRRVVFCPGLLLPLFALSCAATPQAANPFTGPPASPDIALRIEKIKLTPEACTVTFWISGGLPTGYVRFDDWFADAELSAGLRFWRVGYWQSYCIGPAFGDDAGSYDAEHLPTGVLVRWSETLTYTWPMTDGAYHLVESDSCGGQTRKFLPDDMYAVDFVQTLRFARNDEPVFHPVFVRSRNKLWIQVRDGVSKEYPAWGE